MTHGFQPPPQNLIVPLVGLYTPAEYAKSAEYTKCAKCAEDRLAQAIAYAEQSQSNVRRFQRGEGTLTDQLEAQAKFDLVEASSRVNKTALSWSQ